MLHNSWRCVAKINEVPRSSILITLAEKIDNAEMLSVPAHNSSPKTKLFLSARFRILRNSLISTAKDDSPLKILSLLLMRVNRLVYGLKTMPSHGTKWPLCASITLSPTAFINELFPEAFVPNRSIPFARLKLS